MTAYLIGDSHVGALHAAQGKYLPETGSWLKIRGLGTANYLREPFFAESDRGLAFTPEPWRERFLATTGSEVFTSDAVYGLSVGFHTLRFAKDALWADSAPAWMAAPGRHALSRGLVTEMVRCELRWVTAFYDRLIALGVRFFLISSPPPRRDHPAMRPKDVAVRIEVDRVYRQRLQDELDARGVVYVLPPAEAVDADGFLRDEYRLISGVRGLDFHHANPTYGRLMLAKIIAHINPSCSVCRASPTP